MSETAPDTAHAALISDHPFAAAVWWECCTTCGLSMAAHVSLSDAARTQRVDELAALEYRCPECVRQDQTIVVDGALQRVHTDCPHRWGG